MTLVLQIAAGVALALSLPTLIHAAWHVTAFVAALVFWHLPKMLFEDFVPSAASRRECGQAWRRSKARFARWWRAEPKLPAYARNGTHSARSAKL